MPFDDPATGERLAAARLAARRSAQDISLTHRPPANLEAGRAGQRAIEAGMRKWPGDVATTVANVAAHIPTAVIPGAGLAAQYLFDRHARQPIEGAVERRLYGQAQAPTGHPMEGFTRALNPALMVDPMRAARGVRAVAGAVPPLAATRAEPITAAAQQGVFAGLLAKTADKDALQRAQLMTAGGADPREVWTQTGWFRSPDGHWKFEIDDSKSMFNTSIINGRKQENALTHAPLTTDYGPTTKFWEHPELDAAYDPKELMPSTYLRTKYDPLSGVQAAFDPHERSTTLYAPVRPDEAKKALSHEAQHAIQTHEKWSPGGAPDQAFRDPKMWGSANAQGSKIAYEMLAAKMKELQTPLPVEDYARQAWGTDTVTPEIAQAYEQYAAQARKPVPPYIAAEAQKMVARQWYERLAGEAEARAAAARQPMSADERRQVFPLDSYDIPLSDLIFLRPK